MKIRVTSEKSANKNTKSRNTCHTGIVHTTSKR